MRRPARWTVALLACSGLVLGGCGSGAPEPPAAAPTHVAGSPAEAAAESTVRTDRDPIARRFPGLGAFREVRWVGGTLGDDRVPGPSTYFIDAVVTLGPADAARLAATPDLAPSDPPAPPAALLPQLPAGAWSRSDRLDGELAPPQWRATIRLLRDSPVAYLSATGE